MTANANQRPELDDVLAIIAAAPNPLDVQVLRTWMEKYPDFSSEIVDFATDLAEMEAVHSEHSVTTEDIDLVVNRTMSRVQALLDAAEQPDMLTDLAAEIHAAGHDLDSFQCMVGIDRSIMDCLISRLVKPMTVPAKLVHALATTLNRSVEHVHQYLRLPPQQIAAYKSRKRPEIQQADFAMIVQHSLLSDAEKMRWLAEVPDPFLQE